MASINDGAIHTTGELPAVGGKLPEFKGTNRKREDVSIASFPGWRVISLFPSIDTGVCATSVRTFNERASGREGVTVINVSADLPFAQARWCGAEGLDNVVTLSTFRTDALDVLGTRIAGGPMAGTSARAVLVVDPEGVVRYAQLVPVLGQEPDYDSALRAIG
ncbi:MAG TPA: thiol peroxidase [Myxococcota bacterium]|nr:thiol peroxidase [Myxococcota bacterium]